MKAINTVNVYLCKMIAADGEGATKLLECTVTGAATTDIAKTVAKSNREELKTHNCPGRINQLVIVKIEKWSEATDERSSLRKENP